MKSKEFLKSGSDGIVSSSWASIVINGSKVITLNSDTNVAPDNILTFPRLLDKNELLIDLS